MLHPPKHHDLGTNGALIQGEQGCCRQTVIFGTITEITFTETEGDISVKYTMSTADGERVAIPNGAEFFKFGRYFERADLADALLARANPAPSALESEAEPVSAPDSTGIDGLPF